MNFDRKPETREAVQEFTRFCRAELEPRAEEFDRADSARQSDMLSTAIAWLVERKYSHVMGLDSGNGSGQSLVDAVPFVTALAGSCPSTFITLDYSIGLVGGLIAIAGTERQKSRYLNDLCEGRMLGAFASAEQNFESSPFDFSTLATKTRHGWVLEGSKTFVMNGSRATVFVVLAITDPSAGERALSLFLVPGDSTGLNVGERLRTTGFRGAAVCDVTLEGCLVPEDSLLGAEGVGYELYSTAMTKGRIRSAAAAIGISRACLERALQQTMLTRIGGKSLFSNQEFSFKLADMRTLIDTSEQLTNYAAWCVDTGRSEASAQASAAKLFAGESATKIAHMARQMFGGSGLVGNHPIERLFRDATCIEIDRGLPELHRRDIAADVLKQHGRQAASPTFPQLQSTVRKNKMPSRLAKRVAICAIAQTSWEREKKDERFQGMALEVLESLLQQTKLDFSEDGGIDTSISVSDDVFDARTISDNAMTDVLGAHYRCEEKVAQEGIQAIYYGLATILSGQTDIVLILGHCKESQPNSRNMVTHMAFDPFFTRPVGLDFLNMAALQARAYMEKASIDERLLAEIVVRARQRGLKNPATSSLSPLTLDQVLSSPMLSDPIRQNHAYPVSDGAIGMILASEERAKELTDIPIWITGVGNCFDSFFPGDRDLTGNYSLKKAAERAYERAGISDEASAFDVIELSDQYAYQMPLWAEGLGLCGEGKGGDWLRESGPDRMHVNESGGLLAGNPMILGGLVRAAEAARQLTGAAEYRQANGARKALAHGVMGPAGQFHSVIILERD